MLSLIHTEKDAPKGVLLARFFGRRAVPLHLSGFPCPYQRRVVDTKFTTSKNLYPSFSLSTPMISFHMYPSRTPESL